MALARTLAPGPRLVLMDEPFSNLDAARRVETRQEVRALLRQAGSAAILVTHDQEEAMALADQVAVMHAGRVVQCDQPDMVYRNPCTCFVAAFLGRSMIVTGEARGDVTATVFGDLPLASPAVGPVNIAIRPEQFVLTPDREGPARVCEREYRGHDMSYVVRHHDRRINVIVSEVEQFPIGGRVGITIRGPVAALTSAS